MVRVEVTIREFSYLHLNRMDSLNVGSLVERLHLHNNCASSPFLPGYVGLRAYRTRMLDQSLCTQDDAYAGWLFAADKLQDDERLGWVNDEGSIPVQCPKRRAAIETHGSNPVVVSRWGTE